MLQLLFFLLAIGMGCYGAITGNLRALTIAAIAMCIGASGLVTPLATAQHQRQQRLGRWLHRYGWLLFLFLAVGTAGLTLREIQTDEFSKGSALYWLMTIALLVVAGIVHDHVDGATIDGGTVDSELTAAETEPVAKGAGRSRLRRTRQWVQRARGGSALDWFFVLAITGVALWLRLHQLNDFLPTMHGDEGEMGELARLALYGPASGIRPVPLPLFGIGFLDHPTLFHYMQAGALVLFGDTLTGLRTLSAFFGALCVPPLYFLVRRGWGQVAAVVAAWFLAVSHLHIHYSRIALNNIQSVWAMVLLIMLFVWAATPNGSTAVVPTKQAQQPRPILLFILAGLTIGVSQYFYYGSRLLPVIAGLLVLILLVRRQFTFAQLTALSVATILPYTPLLYLYSRNWQSFLNRTKGVSSFSPEGMTQILGPEATWPADIPQLFWEQLKQNMIFFVDTGDRSSFYLQDLPGFDAVMVLCIWLGLGLLVARLRRFPNLAVLIWGVVGLLLAGVLTTGAPYGPRLIVMVPAVFVIAALPFHALQRALQAVWPAAARWVMGILLVVIGLTTLQANYSTYFDRYQRFTPNQMPITMAHLIRDRSDNHIFYILGPPNFYADYSVLRFTTPESERHNVMNAEEVKAAILATQQAAIANASAPAKAKGVLVIALLHRLSELDTLISDFPGGDRQEYTRNGQLLFVTYELPTETDIVESTLGNQDVREDEESEPGLSSSGALPTDLANNDGNISPLATPTE